MEKKKVTQKEKSRGQRPELKVTENDSRKQKWILINPHPLPAEQGEVATCTLDFRNAMAQWLP